MGADFTPQIEVRLRYKYARIKRDIQIAQETFERKNKDEATSLKMAGERRVGEILEEQRKEKESEKGRDKVECPMRKQLSKMKAFSVRDFDFGSSEADS